MKFREPLPEGCPPVAADEIAETRYVFRLIRSTLPNESDFQSQQVERPDRTFEGVDECRVRGLSVYARLQDAEKRLKMPKMRGRKVCRVRLNAGAGFIQQTGRDSHHTWWPYAAYDILSRCEVEQT